MKIFIYKLTSPNGKSYVGQTYNLRKRLKEHKVTKSVVGSALRKYGIQNFEIDVLWTTIDPKLADRIEIVAIQCYNCMVPNGYNLREGGKAPKGWKHTKETTRKLSTRVFSDEWKRKIGDGNRGNKRPDQSERMKLNWQDPIFREKMRDHHKGGRKKTSRETRICTAPGCDNTFECKVTIKQKYCCPGHSRLGKKQIQETVDKRVASYMETCRKRKHTEEIE